MRGVSRQVLDGDESEVVVAVWNLLLPNGIDDIDLRGDLVARAQPGLAHGGQRVVGVVLGEHVRRMQRELLCGIPDPVVGAGLAEVVACGQAMRVLVGDDCEERIARPRHDIGGEGALEDDDTGPIGQCPNQPRPQRAPIGCRGVGRGVDEHIAADIKGMRIRRSTMRMSSSRVRPRELVLL